MGIDNIILGKRIQQARKAQGLTQKQLGEKLGLSTGTVQQYELGKRQPRFETIERIAKLLNTTVLHLLDEDYAILYDGRQYSINEIIHHATDEEEWLILTEGAFTVDENDPDSVSSYLKKLLPDRRQAMMEIIAACDLLSSLGLAKVLERIDELMELPKYRLKIAKTIPLTNDSTDTIQE